MTFSIVQMYFIIQYTVSEWHYKLSVFSSVYYKYMQFLSLQPQWYIYTVALLSPLMLVVVEKAIYEATSVKQSYCEYKTVFFCLIYWVRSEIHVWQFQVFEFISGYGCWLFHPCFFAFFSDLYFLIFSNIIFSSLTYFCSSVINW